MINDSYLLSQNNYYQLVLGRWINLLYWKPNLENTMLNKLDMSVRILPTLFVTKNLQSKSQH